MIIYLIIIDLFLSCNDESATINEQSEKLLYFYDYYNSFNHNNNINNNNNNDNYFDNNRVRRNKKSLSLSEKLNKINMLEGLINFTSKFSNEVINTVVMNKLTWTFHECETNIWMIVAISNNCNDDYNFNENDTDDDDDDDDDYNNYGNADNYNIHDNHQEYSQYYNDDAFYSHLPNSYSIDIMLRYLYKMYYILYGSMTSYLYGYNNHHLHHEIHNNNNDGHANNNDGSESKTNQLNNNCQVNNDSNHNFNISNSSSGSSCTDLNNSIYINHINEIKKIRRDIRKIEIRLQQEVRDYESIKARLVQFNNNYDSIHNNNDNYNDDNIVDGVDHQHHHHHHHDVKIVVNSDDINVVNIDDDYVDRNRVDDCYAHDNYVRIEESKDYNKDLIDEIQFQSEYSIPKSSYHDESAEVETLGCLNI
jgi:hypothetical protein